MLDKRLYRDVSDLLELNVSDDKIVRILLVRGFTTEQVKRAIKDIRTKGELRPEPVRRAAAVTETIESGPSKRFGFLNKFFPRSQSEEEVLAEEARKLADEEQKLKAEEAKIHAEIQSVIDKAQSLEGGPKVRIKTVETVPQEIKDVLRAVDELLEKLPEQEIERFTQSPQFEKYKAVMKKYAA